MKNTGLEILKAKWKSNRKWLVFVLMLLIILIIIRLMWGCHAGQTHEELESKVDKETFQEQVITNENGEIIDTVETTAEEEQISTYGDNEVSFDEDGWDEAENNTKGNKKTQPGMSKGEKGSKQINHEQTKASPDKETTEKNKTEDNRKHDEPQKTKKEEEKNTEKRTEKKTEVVTEKKTVPETTTKKKVKPGEDGWTPIVKP